MLPAVWHHIVPMHEKRLIRVLLGHNPPYKVQGNCALRVGQVNHCRADSAEWYEFASIHSWGRVYSPKRVGGHRKAHLNTIAAVEKFSFNEIEADAYAESREHGGLTSIEDD